MSRNLEFQMKKDVDGVVIVSDMEGMEEQGFWKPGMDFGKQVGT